MITSRRRSTSIGARSTRARCCARCWALPGRRASGINPPVDTRARHLLVELHGCDRALLNDAEGLRSILRRAAAEAGATVVAEVLHPYSPHGVTGVFVIEESHFSL